MNDQKKLWSGYVLGTAGLLMIYLLPQLVGAVSEQFGLSPRQAGFFASSDLIGYSLSSISSYFWIRKYNWKNMAWLSIAIMVLGNLSSVYIDSFSLLIAARVITGLGQGIAVALTLVLVSDSLSTDRNFAIYLILTLLVGAVGVELLAPYLATMQAAPIYYCQIVLALISIPFVMIWLPKAGNEEETAEESSPMNGIVLACLGGIFLMFVGYGGLWSMTERIGIANQLDIAYISEILSIALLAAIPALLIPIIIGTRFGRIIPLVISILGLVVYGLFVGIDNDESMFAISVIAGSFGVNMILPYLTGIISDNDKTGKGVVMVTPMYSIGFAIGPALLSLFVIGANYQTAGYIATAVFALVFVTYLWAIRSSRKTQLG